jgi:hypothetical protein
MISKKGYKSNSPDKNRKYNIIPSSNITMDDVEFPILGIDEYGNSTVMFPGEDYKFPGKSVLEIPLKEDGGMYIKDSGKGKFIQWAKKNGYSMSQAILNGKNSSDPDVRRMATFAANASKWKNQTGGKHFDTAKYYGIQPDENSSGKLENLKDSTFNNTLGTLNNLTDSESPLNFLPDRGFFGAIKGVSGAASAISGSALGYSKLFNKSEPNPKGFNSNYEGVEDLLTEPTSIKSEYSNNRALGENYKPVQDYFNNFNFNFNNNDQPEYNNKPDFGDDESRYLKRGGKLKKCQFGKPIEYSQDGDITNNLINRPKIGGAESLFSTLPDADWLNNLYPDFMPQPQIKNGVDPNVIEEPAMQPNTQVNTKYGDQAGFKAASNSLLGLNMLNNSLGKNKSYQQYQQILRKMGNTNNINKTNPSNVFGDTKLNFKEGGVYEMDENQIQQILKNGGTVEYLD